MSYTHYSVQIKHQSQESWVIYATRSIHTSKHKTHLIHTSKQTLKTHLIQISKQTLKTQIDSHIKHKIHLSQKKTLNKLFLASVWEKGWWSMPHGQALEAHHLVPSNCPPGVPVTLDWQGLESCCLGKMDDLHESSEVVNLEDLVVESLD